MKYNEFKEKYKQLEFAEFFYENEWECLEKIHIYLFSNGRTRLLNEDLKFLKQKLEETISSFEENPRENLENLLYLLGLICLYQPFYDGNYRTTFLYLKYCFLRKKVSFNYEFSNNPNEYKEFIPLFYDEKDSVQENTLKKLHCHINW